MTNRSPGDPLNPQNLSGAQGLPFDGFVIPSHIVHVGNGQIHMDTPTLLPIPLLHAEYKSTDVPFQKLRTDYKP